MQNPGTGEICQSAKCLLCKQEGLGLNLQHLHRTMCTYPALWERGDRRITEALFYFAFCCCDKYRDPKQLGEARAYSALQVIVRHEAKAGAPGKTTERACLLWLILSYLSYVAQAHNGLGPHTEIRSRKFPHKRAI